MSGPADFAAWVAASPLAHWASASPWAYPVANVLHVLGAVALLGAIGLLDLRLLGYGRALEAAALARAVIPLAAGGLAVQLASGAVLFAADAPTLLVSTVFQVKLALILLGLANVLLFHRLQPPWGPAARISAAISLATWTGVVVLGRLIAYL